MATPAELLNIGAAAGQNHFAVQVAREGDASVLVKSQADLAGGYDETPYFTPNGNDTAVQLNAPVDGPTTDGSSFARCELREVNPDGSNAGWNPFTGTHYVRGRTRITHLPASGKAIVLAQLFNTAASADRVSIRTQLVSGTVRLRVRINGTSVAGGPGASLDVYPPGEANLLGREFEWMIKVVAGVLSVYIDDLDNPWVTSSALVNTGGPTWYFKAGCYNQSNQSTEAATEYGAVELRRLQHWHTGWAAPDRTLPPLPFIRQVVANSVPWNSASNTNSVTISPKLGDLLVAIQNIDYGELNQGPGPEPGGWIDQVVSAYGGNSVPYTRAWTSKATQEGLQAVSVKHTDSSTSSNLVVLVIGGANADDPIDWADIWSGDSSGSPGEQYAVGGTMSFPNELVVFALGAGTAENDVGDYTMPAGIPKYAETDATPYSTLAVGAEVIPTSGVINFYTAGYQRSTSPSTPVRYSSITLAIRAAEFHAPASPVSSALGLTNSVTVRKKTHAQINSQLGISSGAGQSKAVDLDVDSDLALGSLTGSVKDVRSAPPGGPIDLSLWAIDDDGAYLGPLPDAVSIDVSPVVNDAGSIRITYPRAGLNFDLLHGPVIEDRDREVAIWVGGRETGSMRALLNEASGDEVGEEAVWTFSGTMLNGRMNEAIVYPNAADEKQETHFAAATAGSVMATLMQQAHARGALLDISFDTFTDVTGSNGRPFSKVITMALSPGTRYLQVLSTLVEYGLCDWEVTPDHRLRLYEPDTRGKDLTEAWPPVVLRRGKDLTDSPRQHSVKGSVTALLAAGKDGLYAEEDDPTALARRGRRIESYVSQGNIDDAGSLLAYTQAALASQVKGTTALSQGLTMAAGGPLPIADFDLFDWVYSDNRNGLERYRVSQWTITQDRNGRQTGSAALNDLTAEYSVALAKRLAALEAGSAVVGTSAPGPTEPDTLAPAAPTGVVGSGLAYQDAETGSTFCAVTAGWSPVTTNADGTAIFDLAGYRARYRYTQLQQVGGLPPPEDWGPPEDGSGQWIDLGETNAATTRVFFSGVEPAQMIEIQAQAFDRWGNSSAWSTGFVMQTDNDTVAPARPSIPTVTQRIGTIRVDWDGKGALGEAMPPDFQLAEVHLSTVQNFTPDATTLRDKLFGASSTGVGGLLYGVTYFVKLVAVDLAGNRSPASGEAQTTPQPIFGDDIFEGAVGEVHLAYAAVTEAAIKRLAVNEAHIASVNAGSIVSGTGFFDLLLAGRIRTGDTGARIELDAASFRQYGPDETIRTQFNALDGSALITGHLRSNITGKRWEVSPDGELRLYPSAGAKYVSLQNNVNGAGVQEMVLRGQLNTGAEEGRSGYLRVSQNGIAIQYGIPGAEAVLSQLSVKKSNIDMTAPVNGLRVDKRYPTADGSIYRNVLVFNDADGNDIADTALHHRQWNTASTALHMPGRNLAILFDNSDSGGHGGGFNDAVWLVYNNGNAADLHCGNVYAPNVTAPSGSDLKEAVTELPYEPLALVRAAPARQWQYKPGVLDRPPTDEKPFKVRRRKTGTPKDTDNPDDFEIVEVDTTRARRDVRAPRRRVGPMAEDVRQVAPDMVTEHDGQLDLSYFDLVGALWAAVIQLADKVDQLTDKHPDVPALPGRRPKPVKDR